MATVRRELLLAPYGIDKNGEPYGPNGTQKLVLDWVDNERKKWKENNDRREKGEEVSETIPVLFLQGGVGSGKTRALMAPCQEMLFEIPGIKVLWGRQDFKDLKLSVMDKFFEVLPQEVISGKSEQYHHYDIDQVGKRGKSKGRIYFNGLKDLSGFSSQEFALIIITEAYEITENTYRTLKRRCRQANVPTMILMESEAPNENHWLVNITNPAHESFDKDITKFEVSTYENWNNLPAAYRGSLESMPEAWKRKYLLGKNGFIPDGKPYYSGFKETIHTQELEWLPSKPLICGWDFGYHHPAVLISQIDLQDRWLWLREIIGNDVTIDKFGDAFIAFINQNFPGAELIHYGDPAVAQVNDKSEQTSWQILAAKGIRIVYQNSTYRLRKEIIEKKLATLNAGKPEIILDSRHCRTAVEGFLGGYHYPEIKPGVPVPDSADLPVKDGYYEHIMNAGEYVAINMFKPFKSNFKKTREQKGRV